MTRALACAAILALAAVAACSKSSVDSAQNTVVSAVESAMPGLASAVPEVASDAAITAKIEGHFTEIDPASTLHVAVTVRSGTVKLSGKVRSADVARRFVAAANGVSGVKNVSSTLAVDPSLPNAVAGAKDVALGAAVQAKLVEEGGLNGARVRVTARGGAITLSGRVDSAPAAAALVQAAKSVAGVTSVDDKLESR
jgi:osmotically-inducible protein OsmY